MGRSIFGAATVGTPSEFSPQIICLTVNPSKWKHSSSAQASGHQDRPPQARQELHPDLEAAVFDAYGWAAFLVKDPPWCGGVSPSLANEEAPALTSHAPTVIDRRYKPATR
jgi:hypothetical protein